MLFRSRSTIAPSLPPGTYTVRLTADGQARETQVEIQRHPWIEDVTDEDLHAQYAFSHQIWEKVNEANSAVVQIRRARTQLMEPLEGTDDRGLREAAHAFLTKAGEVEGNIYQVRNRSNQDPLNFPIKVNNRLANLLSMVERGEGRPNDGMREVFQIMVDELAGYTETLDGIWANELAAVNGELERLGLEPLDPWDETTVLVAPEG